MTEETIEEFRERIKRIYSHCQYYDRQGKEIDILEMGSLHENPNYRCVKQEKVGNYFVSTIWLGMNINFFKERPPIIFETMIYNEEAEEIDGYTERYSTEEEAIKGHEVAVQLCKDKIKECPEGGSAKDSQSEDQDLSV